MMQYWIFEWWPDNYYSTKLSLEYVNWSYKRNITYINNTIIIRNEDALNCILHKPHLDGNPTKYQIIYGNHVLVARNFHNLWSVISVRTFAYQKMCNQDIQ